MKIAQVSTVALTTPPRKYGGTELVVSELARGLTALGHDVTLFATGDSAPACLLKSCFPSPVWPPNELAEVRHASFAWAEVARSLHDFDVVHLHHAAGLPFARLVSVPTVYTIHHCRVDALVEHYCAYPDIGYVAISDRQRELLPELSVQRVVHHGLDPSQYPAGSGSGGYVAFLGRFASEKAPHIAVRAARLAGTPIRLGGTAHEVGLDYQHAVLEPELRAFPAAECCGELAHDAKVELLSGARALLFPIQWEEPFGLVMIEAMLIGTPVIAFRHGSAAEVVEDGLTGYLVDSAEEMAHCIGRLEHIDRARCRQRAQERWATQRMAKEYESLYAKMLAPKKQRSARASSSAIIANTRYVAQSVTPSARAGARAEPPSSCSRSEPRASTSTKELDHGTAVGARRG